MISVNRLARAADQGAHQRILDELSRGGRPMPLQARLRLSSPETRAPAAIGLALGRILELSRGVNGRMTGQVRRLATLLIERQRPDGGFGSPAATAIATGALLDLLDSLARDSGAPAEDLADRARAAADAGLHWLHGAQGWSAVDCEGEERPCLIGDELDSAITLWALAGRPEFDCAVRGDDLREALAASGALGRREIRDLLALSPAASPAVAAPAAAESPRLAPGLGLAA